MTWDTTTPVGSEALTNGDNRIRELKTDIQTALQAQGSFPGADTANPKYKWTPEYGNTAARPSLILVSGQLYINTQTGTIQRYNGATWDDVLSVADAAITAAKLAAAVAGNGLSGGAGSALAVNVDDSTIEINTDALRVKDAGITAAKLAAAVAGNGLSGGAGSALAVNVDNSTLEINSDTLRMKDAGTTEAKLASGVVVKLGQNIGLVARVHNNVSGFGGSSGVFVDAVNYAGQGRLDGVGVIRAGANVDIQIIIDGVTHNTVTFTANGYVGLSVQGANMFNNGGSDMKALGLLFKTSLQVQMKSTDVSSDYTTIQYERQA